MLRWFILRNNVDGASPRSLRQNLAYLRALAGASIRVRLARDDLHGQMDYVKRLALELEQAKDAVPFLARMLHERAKELRQIHVDRRAPVDHITSRPLVP